MYLINDTYEKTKNTVELESDVISFAKDYADRINEEKEPDDSKIEIEDFDDAVDVLESANIYVTKV